MVLFEIRQRFKGHFLNELRVTFNAICDEKKKIYSACNKNFYLGADKEGISEAQPVTP